VKKVQELQMKKISNSKGSKFKRAYTLGRIDAIIKAYRGFNNIIITGLFNNTAANQHHVL
jgi:hypothetical protein